MTSRLDAIAARPHVAPAPAPAARAVEEDPPAGLVLADPQPVRAPGDDRLGERLHQASERVAEGIDGIALADRDALGSRRELDDLTGAQGPVDDLDRLRVRRALDGDGVRHLAQRVTDTVDARQPSRGAPADPGCSALGARRVGAEQPSIREPREGGIEAGEVLDGPGLGQLQRVHEVERVVEGGGVTAPVVRHGVTTIVRLTG